MNIQFLTIPQKPAWNLIVHEPLPGALNLAIDELLLSRVSCPGIPSVTYLRFYQWDRPTLSIGFGQKSDRIVDLDFCYDQNIAVVRRLTGGKAVLHDCEVTYAVISNDRTFFPLGDILATYEKIAAALRMGFRHLNLEIAVADDLQAEKTKLRQPFSAACFASANRYELLVRGRKLVGSAQRQTKNAFLQQGSILVRFDAELLSRVLKLRNSESLYLQITDLEKCLGTSPSNGTVIGGLTQGFAELFDIELRPQELDDNFLQAARVLSRTKYAVLDWSPLPKMA